MFIQKQKYKLAYFISISSLAVLILIGLTFFDKKVMNLDVKSNFVNQAFMVIYFIYNVAEYPLVFISFFILLNFYITMLAKANRNNYILILFIVFNAIHLYFLWDKTVAFYMASNQYNWETVFCFIVIAITIFTGCLLFSMYLSFFKKYRTISSLNFLGTQTSYGVVFYFGLLASCALLRIIFGRDENSNLWFVPNFKSNYYIEERYYSQFPSIIVEGIGMLLYVSFLFSKKNKWYQAAYNTFVFLIMIAAMIIESLSQGYFLTDGFIAIIIVIVWFYVSKLIITKIYGNISNKRARVYGGEPTETKQMKRERKRATKENDKIRKQNEKLAKKQQKQEESKKNKAKSKVDKEIEDLLKKAAKDHKKKIKNGEYDSPPKDDSENLKH